MYSAQFKDFLRVLVISLLVLVPTLGGYPLLEPDEARYVEIPREMVVTGEYVVPRLNGVIYIEKPPLFYWAQTLAIHAFGIQEIPLRFFNAFFAALTAAFVCFAGAVLYDRKTGILASIFLLSSLFFYAMSHFITLDMSLTAMLTGSLLSFLLGLQYPDSKLRRGWFYAGYAFAALAVLSKGLVGIVLPAGIVFVWLLLSRRWLELKYAYIPSGLCLFLMIAAPWHLIMQDRVPAFFDFYIIGQHFMRYATLAAKRYQPWWFFIPILLAGLLPWLFFNLRAFYRLAERIVKEKTCEANTLFLLVWAVFIFLFFSASHSKLVPYILPVMPPLALIFARDMATHSRSKKEWGWTIGLLIAFVVLGLSVPTVVGGRIQEYALPFALCSLFMLGACGVITVFLKRQQENNALITLGISAIIVFTVMIHLWSSLSDRSVKPIAIMINQQKGQYDELISFGNYIQDLPVYTQQLVTLSARPNELSFGVKQEDHADRFINTETFLERWNNKQHRVLAVMGVHRYESLVESSGIHSRVIARTTRYVLISNH